MNFFPPFIEALLYLFAIGLGIGSYIRDIDGIPYINFIAPAILAIAVMNSAFFECTYGSYVRMYYQKSFDAMIATPLSIEDVIAGELLWGATRSRHVRDHHAPGPRRVRGCLAPALDSLLYRLHSLAD